MEGPTIKTERLVIRPWKEADLSSFAALNGDPRVMEHFPSTLTREESDRLATFIQDKFQKHGYCFWAVSAPGVADFIGFIGLNFLEPTNLPVPFTPAVEVGWRLAFDYWGKGYASEGARACLDYGFNELDLKEIVAYTAEQNSRSRAVMERINMQRNPDDDFDHPKLPEGHRLQRHVLYRIKRSS